MTLSEDNKKATFPCKGCEKRQLGCHASCEEYKEAAEREKKLWQDYNKKHRNLRKDSYERVVHSRGKNSIIYRRTYGGSKVH